MSIERKSETIRDMLLRPRPNGIDIGGAVLNILRNFGVFLLVLSVVIAAIFPIVFIAMAIMCMCHMR